MLKKIKQKIKDNPDEATAIAIIGTTVVAGVALFAVAIKAAADEAEAIAKEQEEFDNWKNEEYSNGNVVVQLADGSYIGVPPQSLVS
jgi:hypothetical protein